MHAVNWPRRQGHSDLAARTLAVLAAVLAGPAARPAAPPPDRETAWTRNPVSAERGLPDTFDPASGRNIKWVVPLGTETHATPLVAEGGIFIGTNNNAPRDARHQGDRGVLFCLNEADGALRWQLVVPKRVEDIYFDWPNSGICSPPAVEGDRVYVVDNRGVVLCLDRHGLANGNDGPFRLEDIYYAPQPTNDLARGAPAALGPDGTFLPDAPPPRRLPPGPLDADILWMFDLTSGAGIWSHDAVHSGILIYGDHLYLNTGTGVDNTHRRIRRPEAPGLIVLDKHTGRLLARERAVRGERIFHATWSPPTLGLVRGRPLVFFAGGDGVVRAFEPLATDARPAAEPVALRQVWEFDFDPDAPKEDVHRYHQNRRQSPSNIYGAPVPHAGRVYVAGGGDYWWGKNEAWLKCIDATGTGDITRTGLVWSYALGKHVFATPAVHDGLVYLGDTEGVLHCVDAATGRAVWTHEASGDFWASPLVADGKVYVGTRRGEFLILRAGREKQVLHTVSLGAPISATAVAANGVLYVATMNRLFAVALEARGPAVPGT
jgi:outer membrane protein assembly factor BamB